MEFFEYVEDILRESNIDEKFKKFHFLKQNFDKFEFNHNKTSKIFNTPSYAKFTKIVPPQKVPRRRGFDTDEKKAHLLHAIAHIEYSAIDLALDACYRYKNMPKEFYLDWLKVAEDEIRHFIMLNELLDEIGYKYGDIVVHSALFEDANKAISLIERMAIIPRWQEASGLDANMKIIQKLKNYPNTENIIKVLEVILYEEIDHVKKGDKWFKWACDKEGVDYKEKYFEIVNKIYPNRKLKTFVNKDMRLKAGFSCDELNYIAKGKVC